MANHNDTVYWMMYNGNKKKHKNRLRFSLDGGAEGIQHYVALLIVNHKILRFQNKGSIAQIFGKVLFDQVNHSHFHEEVAVASYNPNRIRE
ncbi:hypothetical protein [Brevibacillus reuszeri]|uniref:hypothetical protein n=1 Tax=Brevibacillus reuszeri TaxID=54915 RepID=UPI003D1B9B63